MSNLKDIIKHYTIKHDRVIKNICSPLKDYLGIPHFSYYTIEQDGHFGILSNCPEQLEFFYENKLYRTNPHLKHPHLFRSGYQFTEITPDPYYLEQSAKRFQVRTLFLVLQRRAHSVEGFLFGMPTGALSERDYISRLDLLTKFGSYFKREAQPLIECMKKDNYNLKDAKGQAFFEQDISCPLSSKYPKALQFLKAIRLLSSREEQCLELFQQGHSAQATAAILGLSQRTVEHYFENIKRKLGCSSKQQLLEF